MEAVSNDPQYSDLLSDEDLKKYRILRQNLSSTDCRNCRHKRLQNFCDMLDIIKNFTVKGDGDDWKRQMVCGIVFLSDGIAINTHQLSHLLGKCKSSINGSLQRMKYLPFPCSIKASNELMEHIPWLKSNIQELRQWTLRKKCIITPDPTGISINSAQALSPRQLLPAPILTPTPIIMPQASVQSPQNEDFPEFYQTEQHGFFNDPFCCPVSGWNENNADGDEDFYSLF